MRHWLSFIEGSISQIFFQLSLLCSILSLQIQLFGQTNLTIDPDSTLSNNTSIYDFGIFYVPKTQEAASDFFDNQVHLNAIRLNIIESALNNASNLNDALTLLDNASSILQDISEKTDKVIFIFEKMPAWLSSSSDGSPAATPGWYVLNTRPPASYTDWNNMVTAIVNRIVNDYGINNAYFEIWNEPDLGSWTGTKEAYFQLFKATYSSIKNVNNSLPVGGPASNYWANNINYQTFNDYYSNASGDLSLIGELIDSTTTWNLPLDFISWHNFNLFTGSYQNAIDYIHYKCNTKGISVPPLMISEWNAPSEGRDTEMQRTFAIQTLKTFSQTPIETHVIAAWQDFSPSTQEFHQDYGLLSYGSIHKPVYYGLLNASKLDGNQVKISGPEALPSFCTLNGDTLNLLIANYAPLPILEGLNHTIYQHGVSILSLDSAGYIDLNNNNLNPLDSIYQGLITIPNNHPVNIAINDAISIYQYYQNIFQSQHEINVSINGVVGSHSGTISIIDSTENNYQFVYDSLRNTGNNQSDAITYIRNHQGLNSSNISMTNGHLQLFLEPNAIAFLQFVIPGIAKIEDLQKYALNIYPNPTQSTFFISSSKNPVGRILIKNMQGQVISDQVISDHESIIDLSNYSAGVYILESLDRQQTYKIVKE